MAVKFSTEETVSSPAKGMINHPQKGMVGLTLPILACTTMELEKFCHSTPLSDVNNAIDGGPVLLAPSMVDASDATH